MRPNHELSPWPSDAETQSISLFSLLTAAQGEGAQADAALEDLLTALCSPIRKCALYHVRGLDDASEVAADVVQETLIGLARGVRSCRAETSADVLAWARAATRNAYVDMFRSPGSGLAARVLADELVEDIGRTATLSGEPAPDANSAAMTSLLRVVMEAYGDAVASTGELFWWRLVMSLEWTEIATKFSTTAAGAKRRFQRAQETLRRSVLARVDDLPELERVEVVALLKRFDYADSLTTAIDDGDEPGRAVPPMARTGARRSSLTSSRRGSTASSHEAAA